MAENIELDNIDVDSLFIFQTQFMLYRSVNIIEL
jgi:hypothetical protein